MHFLLRVGNVAPGVVVSVNVYTSQRSISIFCIVGGGGGGHKRRKTKSPDEEREECKNCFCGTSLLYY